MFCHEGQDEIEELLGAADDGVVHELGFAKELHFDFGGVLATCGGFEFHSEDCGQHVEFEIGLSGSDAHGLVDSALGGVVGVAVVGFEAKRVVGVDLIEDFYAGLLEGLFGPLDRFSGFCFFWRVLGDLLGEPALCRAHVYFV